VALIVISQGCAAAVLENLYWQLPQNNYRFHPITRHRCWALMQMQVCHTKFCKLGLAVKVNVGAGFAKVHCGAGYSVRCSSLN
jgi:hypothetical protein